MVTTTAPDLSSVSASYLEWLKRQPLSQRTQRAYLTRLMQFWEYLARVPLGDGDPLQDPPARYRAVRDYKLHLQTVQKVSPATINLALAAIDNFYKFLGGKRPQVRREDLPRQAPKALDLGQQQQLLRAVDGLSSIRDRAIALLLYYTGMRISECAALDMNDLVMNGEAGTVIVRNGKGSKYREIPLNSRIRQVLWGWLQERDSRGISPDEPALFLNQDGTRLSVRSINAILYHVAGFAGFHLSAHVLRHTCLTNLVRHGFDLVLVADIAGHKRLETTQRYSLPSVQDRLRAMESLQIEY